MAKKTELTLAERFEKYAASKAEAVRVCSLVKDHAILDASLDELLSIPGVGRKAALLIMQVAIERGIGKMITPEQLEHFNTGFELSDAFGKARLKNLIFEMREQLLFDRSEVEKWRIIAEKQAEVISDLYFRLEHPDYEQALREDNKTLHEKLQRSLEVQSSLQEYASDLERKLNQNGAQITRPKSWWPEVS